MPPPTKRRKTSAVEEITFDLAAREDYLTGFHKRKQARIKHAQEEAARKEREERIRGRKKLREQRKVDLEKHVQEVNALLRKANEDLEDGSDNGGEGGSNDEGEAKEEWDGFDEPLAVHREDEYIDEDKYTTVTVESVDISKDGFHRVGNEGASENSSDEQPNHKAATNSPEPTSKRRVWTKEKPVNAKPKKKKKKFRYEGKAERKVTRTKERSKSRDQAKARRS